MITEIFLEGNPLDISADISSLLTFAIDDVKDFASRQTAFSKTIVLPGTENNNQLFGNIFETGSSNAYNQLGDNVGYNFNASKSANCLMFQDNLQTFKGTLRLLQINKDRGQPEYEVALNGELTTLNVTLSSSFLDELDFSAYDFNYTVEDIIASWDNTPGSGRYFPLVDYGNYGRYLGSYGKHDWDYRVFRPALYVKEYLDKIFAAAGFRVECALFETDRFKRLIIPYNKKQMTVLRSAILATSRSNSSHVLGPPGGLLITFLQMDTVVSSLFTATDSNSKFTYNSATPQFVALNVGGNGTYKGDDGGFYVGTYLNGVLITGSEVFYPPFAGTTFYGYTFNLNLTINLNDYIQVKYQTAGSWVVGYVTATNFGINVNTPAPIPNPAELGDFVLMNGLLPQNIRQVDFLSSIVKLFNLYVFESQFDDRLIKIEPYVDFYSTDSANSVDWTYKLNRNEVVKIKPMSEINSKIYNFRYKDDNDYYNELYKKRYNQGYGSYIYDSEFEFASQTNNLELIFASTPLVGYVGEDKVYPTIFKRTGPDNAFIEENIDSVIRILQTKKVTGVSSWNIMDDVATVTSLTSYGYAGHFDDPDAPSNDLNFGTLKELFFTLVSGDLSVTQFNVYWSPYMAEITDKDSKMLTGKFYLTPKDIFDLDFSKYVYLDGVLFRLNKITDYNTTIPSDCEVQLLRVINTIY
jgi:hypothetical protein